MLGLVISLVLGEWPQEGFERESNASCTLI